MRYSLQPAPRFRKIAPALFLTALPIMWCAPGVAQEIDPNIQERIESYQPDITSSESKEPVADIVVAPSSVEFVKRRRPEAERVQELNAILEKNGDKKLEGFLASPASNQVLFKKYGIDEFETKKVVTPAVEKKSEGKPAVVNFLLETKGTYDSNATTSNIDTKSDAIFSIAPGVSLTIPVGDKDKLIFAVGSTLVRYEELSAKNNDALNGSVRYRYVVFDARGNISITSRFGVNSIYSAGFDDRQVDFYKPSVMASWEDIPAGPEFCLGSVGDKNCLLAALSATIDRSWSDVDALENESATTAAGLKWVTPFKDLTLSMDGSVKFKHFTNVTGGRDDVVLSASSGFTQKLDGHLTLIGSVSYTDQSSTLDTVEWNGVAVFLALKVTVDPLKK